MPHRARPLHVLVVDDEPEVVEMLRAWLSAAREPAFESHPAHSLAAARALLRERRFDALILDRILGDGDGVELLRDVRARPDTRDLPVVIFSGRDHERELIHGLERGADDYLTKSCTEELFHARLRAVLRRSTAAAGALSTMVAGPGFQLDTADGRLFVDGRVEHLEPKELEVLLILLRRPGLLHSADALCEEAWGTSAPPRNTLETRLSSLRRKLGRRAACLETVRGRGYRLLA